MSLVGSLEDLGLGDILQIITLSRKSGALSLRSDAGEGRVSFRDGLVCGARVKDRTPDLRRLLVDGGELPEAEFESARSEASSSGVALSVALADRLAPERFEALRRGCVERAVLDMFGWESGEFSFEVGDDVMADDFEVVLDAGINAQYLAMEGTRRNDEGGREPEVAADDLSSFADLAQEIAEDDGLGPAPSDPFEAVALTTVERLDSPKGFQTTDHEVEEALEAAISAGTALAAPQAAGKPAAAAAPTGAVPGLVARPPIVVLADELPLLEWVKRALEGEFRRVHIYQKAELAVQRLRQYVARGDSALVLVSPSLGVAREPGFRDVEDLVGRVKKQSPRSTVLWLGDAQASAGADGAVPAAAASDAASPAGPDPGLEQFLCAGVLRALESAPGPGAPPAATASPEATDERLERVIARLEDPGTRGEVLNVVLEFAAEHFQRVALLAVRDGEAMGIAGLGLERAGGPDDLGMRSLAIAVDRSKWLRRVVDSGRTVVAAAQGRGDHELATRLGDSVPSQACLSPVISGGQVVAILYGDNLPDDHPVEAWPALEAALSQAGRVLEEAMAERVGRGG